MKAFSFMTDKGMLQIGVESNGVFHNFSQAWELYKKLQNQGQGPSLPFLQLMVEADFFSAKTFREVMKSLGEKGLSDLKVETPQFESPIGRPQKILCIGRNYKSHVQELGNAVPKEPIFFPKATSSLLAHEGAIRLPQGVGRVDYEGELAVVIGKQAQQVSESQAMDYVAGFSIVNDVTARELQKSDIEAGKPWFRSKSFDTFCPFGPYLLPVDGIDNYAKLELEVRVNGEVKQRGKVSDMIFNIPYLIAYLSRHCTLEPGDVIATGTPAGVGPLASGDIVECEIGPIGILKNYVE